MFQLLQPIWLFALAGISIPVIIHLWNQRPGKTLRVGSIALVTENLVSKKRSIKLSEILLLLLRCLLLSCIALALTSPLWRSRVNNATKGWVLMDRKQVTAAYNRFKPMVDSLLQAGLEFHYFEDGFAKEKLGNALKDTSVSVNNEKASYRSIASLLNTKVDTGLPLYIFTDNYLRNYSGIRTAAALNLHWFVYTPDTTAVPAVADTSVLSVTIFNTLRTNDARYLEAALNAIQQFSKKNISTKIVTAAAAIPARQDWLFRFSEDSIGNDKTAGHVVQYASGKPASCNSYILPAAAASFDAVNLYQSIVENNTADKAAVTYWKDGFGHPILTSQKKDSIDWYLLYTHIDPAWNELPWSDNFPQLLYQLMFTGKTQQARAVVEDRSIIDNSQLLPVLQAKKKSQAKALQFIETDLSGVCWLVAFALFFAERCLSFYQRKQNANG